MAGNMQALSEIVPRRLREWASQKRFSSVQLDEQQSPVNEPYADYTVAYEARFGSRLLDHATIEVVVTSTNYIGIGLETRNRVAERMKIRNIRQGFAAGFEPCEPNDARLIPFLELVSSGKVMIFASTWPFIGLGKTLAAVAPGLQLRELGTFGPVGWLKDAATFSSGGMRGLSFKPWT